MRISTPTRSRYGRAFTLIELIVVIVIMGILIAVGAFAYNSFIKGAKQAAVQDVAHQVSLDVQGYSATKEKAYRDLTEPTLQTEVDDDLQHGYQFNWDGTSATGTVTRTEDGTSTTFNCPPTQVGVACAVGTQVSTSVNPYSSAAYTMTPQAQKVWQYTETLLADAQTRTATVDAGTWDLARLANLFPGSTPQSDGSPWKVHFADGSCYYLLTYATYPEGTMWVAVFEQTCGSVAYGTVWGVGNDVVGPPSGQDLTPFGTEPGDPNSKLQATALLAGSVAPVLDANILNHTLPPAGSTTAENLTTAIRDSALLRDGFTVSGTTSRWTVTLTNSPSNDAAAPTSQFPALTGCNFTLTPIGDGLLKFSTMTC